MQDTLPHILIVDDDSRILELLEEFFSRNNFLVSVANSAFKAMEIISYFTFDLIILDVMLPQITGIEFAKNIKASGNIIPIIMLTALGDIDDRIKGLEAGALDYITKPFEATELLLRVRNLVNSYKHHQKEKSIINLGNNYYNLNTKTLTRDNQIIKLTTTEQILFEFFMANPGRIISREELSNSIGNSQFSLRAVDVSIARIRTKIENNSKEPLYLKTIRGRGYVLYS
ncbi:MAG: response regulator transcription factor [Rickettsiaceae bacterium]|nr:MAG: response regulator transcription factor [Rickettsiaceae bacterium]